jgi:thioredoxin-related protein
MTVPAARPVRYCWRFLLTTITIFMLVFLPPLVGALAGSSRQTPENDYFAPDADLSKALRRAKEDGKSGVVVLYEMHGCGECAKLRADTLNAPGLREYLQQHFVTVSLHADSDLPVRGFAGELTTQSALAESQRVTALPTVVLYDSDGLPVARQVGRAGDQAHWLRLGRYLAEGGYEDAPFASWQPAK